jgi:type IV pilus assembly protein PilY1
VPDEQNLTANVNVVDKTNANLTDALLGTATKPSKVTGIPYRETLLDWANGLDVFDMDSDGSTTDAYKHMGDPLHSEPALVQYGETSGVPDLVAYVATNDGYLHAFNVNNGAEIFSFIPQELLPDLSTAMENIGSQKLYGLDGSIAAWIKDVDNDGTVEPADGDRVYLYFGMRRGGSNIYAMDVTVRTAPKLLWVINGGNGDYTELGDTWSTVNVEKVKDGTSGKTVLIFGGGYDSAQDSVTVRTADSFGRAVFIADALTGERLWTGSASGDTVVSEMLYSIPARVKPLDISGDGYIDRLYAVDMGGQIFRFDINNNNGASLVTSITGGRIADLADNTTSGARRFYYPPDVALMNDHGGKYHGLVIASGYRAHPLDQTIHDRIYMLKDKNTGLVSSGYTLLDDLVDVTGNLAGGNSGAYGDATADAARSAELARITAAEGWYINLDDENTGAWIGEKGLAEPLIIEGNAIVTTYVPDYTTSFDSCAPRAGYGKVFFLDMVDATPAFASSLDLRPERHVNLTRGGIPPSPNAIITKGGEPTICVGAECEKAEFGLGVRKTYWYEVN